MTTDYSGYVDPDYLDRAAQILAAAKQRTHELMDVREGNRVLDVGCGPGSDTLALAELVGDGGEVVGVDADPEMIEEANSRAATAGLGDRVVHRAGDASSLPFDDGHFDACRSERVVQHLTDPRAGLAEMIRVTQPGGRIVVLDTDYASVSVSTELPEIERRLADQWRTMANSPYAPRLLPRWFNESGLTDVAVEIVPIVMDDLGTFSQTFIFDRAMRAAQDAGRITSDEARRFTDDLEEAQRVGGFLATAQMLLVSGRKA